MTQSVLTMTSATERSATQSKLRWEIVTLTVVVLLATLTRLFALDAKSIWLDEAFSIFVARQPLDRMMEIIVAKDTHPPLYHTLLHYWLWLGDTPFSSRLLSALLGIAVVPATYLLGREVAGRRVGVVAALLVTVSPFQVWYAQEVRMYSLLALMCALSAYFLVRALKRGGAWSWVAYTMTTALALYSQLSAVFFVMAEGIAVMLMLTRHFRTPSTRCPVLPTGSLRPWLLSQAALGVLWLPWVPSMLSQMRSHEEYWVETPTVGTLRGFLFEITSAYLPHWQIPRGQEIVVIGGLLLAFLVIVRAGWRQYLIPLVLFVVPVAGLFLVSQVKPVFLSRALIYVSGPYLLLIAITLVTLKRWRLGSVLLGLLLVLNVVSLYRLYSVIPKEEWNLVASYVTARAAPRELTLFLATDAQLAFDYYAAGEAKQLEERGLPEDVLTANSLEPRMGEEDLPRMDQLLNGRDSFWLVDSHSAFVDPQGLARRFVEERYRLVDAKEFQGVKVFHYEAAVAARPAQQQALGAGR
ncbi:MAG: hypothetical protein EPO21_10850 [Chloroflexota bacterium]|nr:MAG: hypothetical protein EPO21_10850 [Chloroflexota bacterium]